MGDDERRDYVAALKSYESGLAFLLEGRTGSSVSEVREYGREDCVSLDSDCESPVPVTETDEVLNMMEVRSCSSRLGSTHSLVGTETPVKMSSSSRSLVGDH